MQIAQRLYKDFCAIVKSKLQTSKYGFRNCNTSFKDSALDQTEMDIFLWESGNYDFSDLNETDLRYILNTGNVGPRTTVIYNITNNYINPLQAFKFTQDVALTVWNIYHGMNFVPNVWAVDENGVEVEGVVSTIDTNSIRITFTSPTKGTAYLS